MPSQRKQKLARAVHANQGVRARYRRRMQRLINEMANSLEYWLRAAYCKRPPRVAELAEDASPSDYINSIFEELAQRWIDRFEESAPFIAEAYAKDILESTDTAMKSALKDAGWTVKFEMTPTVKDALDAVIQENIGLIKSIPQQYLTQVQGSVMRSFSAGRDLETMVKEIKAIYPKASNRATLIARDQSNKATAIVDRTRSLELGITEGIWMHSHAGKTPRPDHVAADGKKFDLRKGCLISGEYIFPGEKIRCGCSYRSVLPI